MKYYENPKLSISKFNVSVTCGEGVVVSSDTNTPIIVVPGKEDRTTVSGTSSTGVSAFE